MLTTQFASGKGRFLGFLFPETNSYSLHYKNGAAQQCQCSRITTLPFFEVGFACGDTLVAKVALQARNRLIGGRWAGSSDAKKAKQAGFEADQLMMRGLKREKGCGSDLVVDQRGWRSVRTERQPAGYSPIRIIIPSCIDWSSLIICPRQTYGDIDSSHGQFVNLIGVTLEFLFEIVK